MYNELLLVSKVYDNLRKLEYDVTLRNEAMNKRDRYVYGDGLWETLKIDNGFDKTEYNYLRRVVDIHTAQLMGQPFNMYSWYDKEDLSIYDPQKDADALKAAELGNKKAKEAADARRTAVEAIIRDNGGYALFKDGARIGSAYGVTVYKGWWDDKAKTYRIQLIESPQNYRAGWSDSNFRERDYDAYTYQISPIAAYKQFGKKLPAGAVFQTANQAQPFGQEGTGATSDPLDQSRNTTMPLQTARPMVTVVDYTGTIEGYKGVNGSLTSCDYGDETEVSVLIVGGHVVETITDPDLIPKYYVINNRVTPRRAWGDSDLPESALQINATIMEKMSDYLTLVNKTLFPMVMAKGFDTSSIPKKRQREMTVVPMDLNQTLEVVNLPQSFGFEYEKLLAELKDAFVRVTGVGRVLFDDPTVNADSNQALMTTLKGVIDIVEDKQTRWEPVLVQMFTDALHVSAKKVPHLADTLMLDENWYFYTRWPSVLRRETAEYQQMFNNRLMQGHISFDSYLEAMGVSDITEEVNRIRDNMKDPVIASILGHGLSELAHFAVFQSMGIPPWGFNPPKVTIKGDMTPQQEGNLAQNYGWNDGPFGASIGPQGREGQAANDNFINQGQITGDPFNGGMPSSLPVGQPLNPSNGPAAATGPQGGGGQAPQSPVLTPSQNTGQQAPSVPGSGATAVSPQGALNMHHQHKGH